MATRRIVLGVDGSEGSAAAQRWCIEYAPALDAEVIAVHGLPPVVTYVPPQTGWFPSKDYDAEVNAAVTAQLQEWCAPLAASGVPFRSFLVDKFPAEALVGMAEEYDAAMIVVGRRGSGGFKELVLGSVPHRLAHHAPRPVVVVPAE